MKVLKLVGISFMVLLMDGCMTATYAKSTHVGTKEQYSVSVSVEK